MPDTRSNPPPVPYVEDCNSDDSTTKPNTKVEARKHAAQRRQSAYPPKLKTRDAASDSGYSSTVASSANSQPNAQPAARAPPPAASKPSKPMIHPTEHQTSHPRPSRSASVSRQPPKCANPTCQDPTCAGSRGAQRGYDLPHRPQPPQQQRSYSTQFPVQNPMAASPYVQQPIHHQPQRPAAQPIPIYGAQPQARPRTSSTSRSRPVSWAPGSYSDATGYPYGGMPQGSYGTQQHGPPPSPSAYLGSYTSQYPGASYMASYLGSGSPRDSYGSHLPPLTSNATLSSSPSGAFPPALPPTYSARQSNPMPHARDSINSDTGHQQSSKPLISARHSSIMPGAFPSDGVVYDSEPQSSSSESEDDEEYEERRRYEREEKRRIHQRERAYRELEDRRAMPPPTLAPPRRPSLKSARTTAADGRHSRETTRRAPYSENDISSSDQIDSDRTTRPVVGKRLTYSPSSSNRHSRQSSVSNGSSSGRTKSSSLSHSSRPPPQQYIVEDAQGHKYHYPTREQAEAKAKRLREDEALRSREQAAQAYQDMRGNTHPALSAENVKRSQAQGTERRPSSHVSGSSKKSAASSSKMSRGGDSTIQIQRGETVFNIPINTTLEVRQTDEGETWFIGSSSPPREKSYHGGSSKSSGSRMGRSRNGSERGTGRRDTIHEEDGYERGL